MEDIEQDEELFSIPHSAILSTHTSELLQHIKADLVDLEPWLRTVLALIYEYGKGRSSRWWPYLRILPKELNTLIFVRMFSLNVQIYVNLRMSYYTYSRIPDPKATA